jgi:hypothetical protein
MSTNSIDWNIDNYNFNDMLKVYKIQDFKNKTECDNKIDNKYNAVSKKYPATDMQQFFLKVKTILKTVIGLVDSQKLQLENIESYINRIKAVKQFEHFNETDLIYKIQIINNANDDDLLNEPNYDVNRINPSLNNKNNTNVIVNTAINEVTPGFLNSLKRITQFLNLNLNSCFRHNYYKSNPCDFLYMLPSEVKNVLSMRLVSIEIPNSWYLFSSKKKNNKFRMEVTIQRKTESFDIWVPDGNYDSDTLQYYLNTTYFYESTTESPLRNFRFSIDPQSLVSRFELIEDSPVDLTSYSLFFIDEISENPMNTMGWTLGFRLGSYLDIEDGICSEGLFDAGGDRYIYVCINDFQYNTNTSSMVCFDRSILNEEVIAKIPMINGKFSLIINDNNNALAKIRKYNGPVNLSRLQIKVLDKFGDVLDINNMDYSLTLELEILYESFNFKNVTA